MACHRLFGYSAAVTVILATLIGWVARPSHAIPSTYPDGFVGELRQYKVGNRESLIEIARRFDLGFNEIQDANPEVDPFLPKPGTLLTIPAAWIPPAVSESERPSVVVNLAELRLFLFPKDSRSDILSFPIGIGDEGTDTPVGTYHIIEKTVSPYWRVPKSIRRQRPELPGVVPPGPENPLGSHALRLSRDSILIHGTNRPWGVGRRSSHGCLRLYPEDIAELFQRVSKGMRVTIINQPVKIGVRDQRVFIELHREQTETIGTGEVLHMMAERGLLQRIDLGKLIRAVDEKKGYPVEISWATGP